MKRNGLGKLVCVALGCLMISSPASVTPSHANDYYSDGPRKPHRNRGGSNLIGPAIGLGITIIQGVRERERRRQQQVPVYNAPPQQTKKPVRTKRPKVTKKPNRKTTKRPTRQAKKPKRPNVTPRIILPETLRVARAKPRTYSIGDKPWASDKDFVVTLRPGLTQAEVEAFLTRYGLTKLEQTRVALLDQVVLKIGYPESMSPQEALLMATDERVFRAQPNYYYYPATDGQAESTDMFAELQYAFAKMGLSRLSGEESGNGVRLAVIDSGIRGDHPAIGGRVTASFTAFPETDGALLNDDHGTAVASIIAAQSGMKGVAQDVTLMSAQVFRFNEAGHMVADSYDIVRGVDWSVSNGAKILNLSFAGAKDQLLEKALQAADAKGVILVAAAGNEGADAPAAYPAAYDNVIAVTATDADDGLYDFANRGEHVELAAPGVDVLVAAGEDGYGLQTGTSMATAYISGSVALMLEREPDLAVDDIKERLARSAFDLGETGRDREFGFGRLDAYKAVTNITQAAQAN